MISHIGLTVSHLPASCSFFLAALQPLGYRYIGQQGNQIGFGLTDKPDFFLCQETPGIKAGAAHIAFSAPDRTAVRDFYTAALGAGARPHGSPATRDEESGVFNAAVLDHDGNSIEVMHQENVDPIDNSQSAGAPSRVLTWRKSVSGSMRDDESIASASTVKTATRTVVPFESPKHAAPGTIVAPSVTTELVARNVDVTQHAHASSNHAKKEMNPELMGDAGARKIIGTLIGAAAGAAVAYAMVKGERDSAKEEAVAAIDISQSASSGRQPFPSAARASEYGFTPSQVQQMIRHQAAQIHRNPGETDSQYSAPRQRMAIEAAPPRSTFTSTFVSSQQSSATGARQAQRNFSETESTYSSVDSRDRYTLALEGGSQTSKNLNPTCVSVPPTSVSRRIDDAQYIPASSVGPRSTYSRSTSGNSIISDTSRSNRAPSHTTSPNPSSKSPPQSGSKAPSLISSFRPDGDDGRKLNLSGARRSSASSVHSSRPRVDRVNGMDGSMERCSSASSAQHPRASSNSRAASLISSFVPNRPPAPAKSTTPSTVERQSSASSVHSAKSKASTVKAHERPRAPSTAGSVPGRNSVHDHDDADGPSDRDTVAPSDSISNAGLSRTWQRHAWPSKADDDDTMSSHSRRSRHSKHSNSSRQSSRSQRPDDADKKSHVSSQSHRSSASRKTERSDDALRPSNVSEPSDASTVKPYKPSRTGSVASVSAKNVHAGDAGKDLSVASFAD